MGFQSDAAAALPGCSSLHLVKLQWNYPGPTSTNRYTSKDRGKRTSRTGEKNGSHIYTVSFTSISTHWYIISHIISIISLHHVNFTLFLTLFLTSYIISHIHIILNPTTRWSRLTGQPDPVYSRVETGWPFGSGSPCHYVRGECE